MIVLTIVRIVRMIVRAITLITLTISLISLMIGSTNTIDIHLSGEGRANHRRTMRSAKALDFFDIIDSVIVLPFLLGEGRLWVIANNE